MKGRSTCSCVKIKPICCVIKVSSLCRQYTYRLSCTKLPHPHAIIIRHVGDIQQVYYGHGLAPRHGDIERVDLTQVGRGEGSTGDQQVS